ncbi:hypothetical protein CPAR01_05507 [Colletotrichum paranaense]|uniref:Uncharacterized protein n=1 Tax=Colletotrichum paranaense TaxID=1914294 RepID=A0ABQ9SS12_9PEZI|nr:uncharacterized protein CPAR01_05507 [Colletotrichum paranaense]KAK1542120.1 hypothetical protein CPAR01_05507 [Colletotrichum paranaense]
MASYAIVLLGLLAMSNAAPQFAIGGGSTILVPGGGATSPNPVGPILLPPTDSPEVKPGKRDLGGPFLERKLSSSDTPMRLSQALAERAEDLNTLKETYFTLLEPIVHGTKPSFGTYVVLLHMADILASKGVEVDTITLGEATTIFSPTTNTKRQIFEIGSCKPSDLISLRATLTSLLLIYSNTPPFEIWNLDEAIIAALKACNEDIIVGPIIPDKPIPGGPLVPDKPVPGRPVVTQSPVPGGPIKPSD